MEIVKDLTVAKTYIESVIQEIEERPKEFEQAELIKKLRLIDDIYKEDCESIDSVIRTEDEPSLYDKGMNNEFTIEGFAWHEISLILRDLK